MKKIIGSLIVLGAVGVGSVLLLQRPGRSRLSATEIAPLETVAFLHLPDLRRSAERWPGTALAKIAREPEVAAFLERPRAKSPAIATVERALSQLARVDPGEAFLAATSLDDSVPKMLAGFSFGGSSGDLDAFLAEPRAAIRTQWPGGKEERTEHEGARITLYRANDFLVCETVHRGWYLSATRLELLQTAVERLEGKAGVEQTLARSATFQSSRAALPDRCELNIYGDLETLAYRIVPLLSATGVTLAPEQLAALKRAKAIAYGLKIEETQFRETGFLLRAGSTAPAPLALSGLALTSPATSLFYTGRIPNEAPPEFATPLSGLWPGLASFQKALVKAGLTPEEMGRVFGNEFALLVDWPTDAAVPSLAFTLELRDPRRAREMVDTLSTESDGAGPWKRTEHRGAVVLSQPGTGLFLMVQPTVAIAERFALFGLSPAGLAGFLDRAAEEGRRLDAVPEFQRAAKLLQPASASFAYLDLPTIISRTYGTFRPLLAMTIALQPGGSGMIDAGKLPNATAISRHLTPLVFSSGETENGFRMESAGPISATQLALAFGGVSFSGSGAWLGKLLPGTPFGPRTLPNLPRNHGQKEAAGAQESDAATKGSGSLTDDTPAVEKGPPADPPKPLSDP